MSKFRLRGKRRRNHRSREGSVPLRAMVPNLITSMAACGGITSIAICATNYAKTLAGQPVGGRDWFLALVALLVACVCDGMDGRVARLLKCSSKLGAELDSLADFVNFGVAPAMFIYFWVLSGSIGLPLATKQVLLAFALFYAMCDAFRLARFNTMLEQPTLPYWKHFFLGVPAPGGCWMVLTPVILALTIPALAPALQHPAFAMFMLLLVGALMASRLPTISLKSVHLTRKYMLPTTAMLILLVAFLFTHFWLTLGVIGAGYILTAPVVGLVFLRVRAKYLREQGGASRDTP
ncbi:MAG: CDP-alcohol phosphatidyltransferase family protein [Kiritimatiellia bacterium]